MRDKSDSLYLIMQPDRAKKIRLIFRQTEANRFTLPVLINRIEATGLDITFQIQVITNKAANTNNKGGWDWTPCLVVPGLQLAFD